MNRVAVFILLLVLGITSLKAQDTLNKKALYINLGTDVAVLSGAYWYLNKAWYQDFEQTKPHWFDDSREWKGMDKMGHAFSAYQLSRLFFWQMKQTGLAKSKSMFLGGLLGFSTISMIECLDSKSSAWGASWSDLTANALGTGLFLGQHLLWNEIRIDFKFSYHSTIYPLYRPKLLGNNAHERILKDYNGQTYWLSSSPYRFGVEWWPRLLNVAVGYGVEGLTGARNNVNYPHSQFDRQHQFYLSLDIDLTQIRTSKKWLKTLLTIFNSIKIPMPAIEYRERRFYGHWLYF